MPDKTANWGVPGSGARYRTQDSDPTGGGNFVVAERLDSNGDPVDVLLEWDEAAGEWVYGGPANFDGEDVTNVGALDANSISTEQTETETINVPSDAATVEAALKKAATTRLSKEAEIVVNIESGHLIQTDVRFEDIDFRNVRITSEDATVGVDDTQLTAGNSIFRFVSCYCPDWDFKLDCNGFECRPLNVISGSVLEVINGSDSGVINAGGTTGATADSPGNNIQISGSLVKAVDADFSGADNRGVRATFSATVILSGAIVDNAGYTGFLLSGGTAYAGGLSADGCGGPGIRIRRGASAQIRSASVANNTDSTQAVLIEGGSNVDASQLTITNAEARGLRVESCASIDLFEASISDSTSDNIFVLNGGRINASNATIENGGVNNISLTGSSFANANGAVLDGATDDAIAMSGGSIANVTGATVGGAAITDADSDISSFNTITSKGIVFDDT